MKIYKKYFLSLLFFLILIVSCNEIRKSTTAKNIIVYKGFPKGGTTNNFKNHFYHLSDTSLDKSKIINNEDFNTAINTAKSIKHFQQKIGGVVFGGSYISEGEKHHFIYLKGNPNLIIDLSKMRTYILKDSLIYK